MNGKMLLNFKLKAILISAFVILKLCEIEGRIGGEVVLSGNVFQRGDETFKEYDVAEVTVYTDDRGEIIKTINTDNKSATLMLQKIYHTFKKRIDSLNRRLVNVEKSTKEIKNRLTKLDCYDLKVEDPLSPTGVYTFFLDYKGKRPVSIYCDMVTEGGGWTVLQRRLPKIINETNSETEFHRKSLYEYTLGFGSPSADHWLGLENIYILTHTRYYELRIELVDFEDLKSYARYSKFYIEGESKGYRMHVSGYSGDAGDSLSSDKGLDNFTSDGMLFSTHDHDRDTSHEINCAEHWDIGGWWFNRCSWANLNGPYKFPNGEEKCIGINWHKWRNMKCLKATKMMIRPIQNY